MSTKRSSTARVVSIAPYLVRRALAAQRRRSGAIHPSLSMERRVAENLTTVLVAMVAEHAMTGSTLATTVEQVVERVIGDLSMRKLNRS